MEADEKTTGASGEAASPPEGETGGRDALWVLGLFLLALAARLVAALQTRVITPDGVEYIRIATMFSAGDAESALAHPQHPLYPFLISLSANVFGNGETSAQAVSVILGAFCLVPLFFLVRSVFGRRAALFAGAGFAFLPPFVRFGADAVSEPTFHFFLLSALALGYAGAAGRPATSLARRSALALLAGACASAAYLTRPEGIALPAAVGGWTLIKTLAGRPRSLRPLLVAAGFSLAFLVLSAPYLLHIRQQTGRFEITKKKPVTHFFSTYQRQHTGGREPDPASDLPEANSPPRALAEVLNTYAENLFYGHLLLALLGLLAAGSHAARTRGEDVKETRTRRRDLVLETYVLLPLALWTLMGGFLAWSHGYVSHRHTSPGALMLLGYAGAGAVFLCDRLGPPLARRTGARPRLLPSRLLAGLALVLAVLGSTTAFRIYREGKMHVIEIGRALEERVGPGKTIAGNRVRIAFYAGGRHVDLPPFAGLEGAVQVLIEEEADLLVIDVLDSHFPVRHPEIHEAFRTPQPPPGGFIFLDRWTIGEETGRARDIRAYRIDREALKARRGKREGAGG